MLFIMSGMIYYSDTEWQARRVSNPQPAVLETAILPIELLTYSEKIELTIINQLSLLFNSKLNNNLLANNKSLT
jgi:hypothetical protein